MMGTCAHRLALAAILLGSNACFAGVIGVPIDHTTIQAAIDAAADGDMVIVAPGTYNEAINFSGKVISVVGSGGPGVTIIDATGLDTSTVRIAVPSGPVGLATLKGFTVTGGSGTLDGPARSGGGIYVTGGTNLIEDCIIIGNTSHQPSGAAGGGGVSAVGPLTMRNCIVAGNSTFGGCGSSSGGGLSLGGDVLLINCTVNQNTTGASCAGIAGGRGGGISYAGDNKTGGLTAINCDIHHNVANGANGSGIGGGIRVFLGTAKLMNCRVVQNRTVNIFSVGSLSAGIHNDGHLTLHACTIADNTWATGQPPGAGGVWNNTNTTCVIDNCIVYGNSGPEIKASTTVQYSCVEGGFSGVGNIGANPAFVDAANGDFRLSVVSPCRDAGDRTLLPADDFDLDGDSNTGETSSRDLALLRRIVNGQVDMGSYEWQHACLPDVSPSTPGAAGNGVTDIDDLVLIITSG
jgi:hypothetical protein